MKRKGFTIIELLVVIAIIAILAAIILPVFARAREKARQASCLSNLKLVGEAFKAYCQDFGQTVTIEHLVKPGDLEQCLVARGAVTWEQLICPSDKKSDIELEVNAIKLGEELTDTHLLSYGWNYPGFKDARGREPDNQATLPLAFDAEQCRFYEPVFPVETIDDTRLGLRHNGSANILFWDGHVKWMSAGNLSNAQVLSKKGYYSKALPAEAPPPRHLPDLEEGQYILEVDEQGEYKIRGRISDLE